MIFFEHIEPGFSRFNGHTPQVIYGRLNTLVTPFIGTAIRNSVEVIFPCGQTVNAGITADFGKCHIHGCRYVRFQLQNLQYLDKQRLPPIGCFQIFLNGNQVLRFLFDHLLEPSTVLLQFHTDSLRFGISSFHFKSINSE